MATVTPLFVTRNRLAEAVTQRHLAANAALAVCLEQHHANLKAHALRYGTDEQLVEAVTELGNIVYAILLDIDPGFEAYATACGEAAHAHDLRGYTEDSVSRGHEEKDDAR